MACSLNANAAFNNKMFSPATIQLVREEAGKVNHESLRRLLEAAGDMGVHGPAALADALEESDQVVSNWGRRGVSKQGALKAQEKLGISALWIREGIAPKMASADAPAGAVVLPLREVRPSLIAELGAALDSMSKLKRDMARTVLLNLVNKEASVAECVAEFEHLLGGAGDEARDLEPKQAAAQ